MNAAPQLSGRYVTAALYALVFVTISILAGVALWIGPTEDHELPVTVKTGRAMIDLPDGSGAVMTDVMIVTNESDDVLTNIDIAINAQYFLYRDPPLRPREVLTLPQSIFCTKSSLRFDPTARPITKITITGRLPSGARGVHHEEMGKR